MALALSFYVPDGPSFRRKASYQASAQLGIDPKGRFLFNAAAVQAVGLRVGDWVLLGNDPATPKEWYLTKSEAGAGYRLERYNNAGSLAFYAAPLRALILATLPHPPARGGLALKLDGMSLAAEGQEIWPLLTAPYWFAAQPTAPAKGVLVAAPAGFLGIKKSAQLYGS